LRLLVVGSQIGNLTLNLSFNLNLCFNYSNGTCKPILDIYLPRTFQWFKYLFNPMSFDLCNCSLKIRDSNFQNENQLGSVWVHSITPSYTFGSMKCDFWASLSARTFVRPCFGCKPKVKVITASFHCHVSLMCTRFLLWW
jgi:hypothetical protein